MKGSCGIVLLAAGSSGRLGKSKQLLPYKGTTLLQHLINEATRSSAIGVVVVLGADAETIRHRIKTENIHIVINEIWNEGMASSIRTGINKLQEIFPKADAAILIVCDQPFVTGLLLNKLIVTHRETGKPIVVSSFDNTGGPPALFHQSMFPELLLLTGDKGARMIVETHSGNVV